MLMAQRMRPVRSALARKRCVRARACGVVAQAGACLERRSRSGRGRRRRCRRPISRSASPKRRAQRTRPRRSSLAMNASGLDPAPVRRFDPNTAIPRSSPVTSAFPSRSALIPWLCCSPAPERASPDQPTAGAVARRPGIAAPRRRELGASSEARGAVAVADHVNVVARPESPPRRHHRTRYHRSVAPT